MAKNKIEILRNYILENYPLYDNGFADVMTPEGTNLIIDREGMEYKGIADTNGNFFYIKALGKIDYTPMVRGSRVMSYKATNLCRIVSMIKNVIDPNHIDLLVSAISMCNNEVKSINSEKTSVFFQETNTKKMSNELENISLISCDFEIVDLVSVKNCKQINCNC
jgi:hypothetical protein